jgi:predicted TIM-barrel fold metal-dependent hydrolase
MATAVVDGLAFVGRSLFGESQSGDELLTRMDATGIGRTVAVSARPPEYDLRPANDAAAALQTEHPDRIIGLGRVDANQPGAAEETRRCLVDLGLRGVFLHPREEVFAVSGPNLDPVLSTCAEFGAPVVVASGFPWVSEALQVADLASRHPEVTVVMTGGGQLNISGLGQTDALLALEQCPNLLVQTNGVYRQDFIESVTRRFGADRVMFASASPQFDQGYELLRVRLADLDEPAKASLLGGTASRVFRL